MRTIAAVFLTFFALPAMAQPAIVANMTANDFIARFVEEADDDVARIPCRIDRSTSCSAKFRILTRVLATAPSTAAGLNYAEISEEARGGEDDFVAACTLVIDVLEPGPFDPDQCREAVDLGGAEFVLGKGYYRIWANATTGQWCMIAKAASTSPSQLRRTVAAAAPEPAEPTPGAGRPRAPALVGGAAGDGEAAR